MAAKSMNRIMIEAYWIGVPSNNSSIKMHCTIMVTNKAKLKAKLNLDSFFILLRSMMSKIYSLNC